MDQYRIPTQLPPTKKAFIAGGGKKGEGVDVSDDFEYLDQANDKTIENWQGNPETQPGDIIVMYCLSPRSYIHSIWRAISPGSIDPFFHFYRNVWIGHPTLVKPIPITEIKADAILSKLSLVKQNMQGINGVELPKWFYDRLLEILAQKGQDIRQLPVLQDDTLTQEDIHDEKDVEKKLLEPLLQKMGYGSNDWLRQMTIRMGRGERYYPDYVIHPITDPGNEGGDWIWEAKFSIKSHKQLENDFRQAKSYALRLSCKGLGLISIEGVWISLINEQYDFSKIRYWSWSQLVQVNFFNEVFDLAGNKFKLF